MALAALWRRKVNFFIIPKPTICPGRWFRNGRQGGTGKLVSSKTYLEILGTSTKHTCPSIFLFTDSYRYLFNCGENTLRLLHEQNRMKSCISRVFLTGMSWRSHVGGLPSLLRYHNSLNVQGISVYGPQGINKFVDDVGFFSGSIHRLKSSEAIQSTEFSNVSDDHSLPYVDDNISIKPMVFESKDKTICNSEKQCICYICEFDSLIGRFLPDKAIGLEVPRELFGDLITGHTVQLKNGSQVQPHEVMTPPTPGQVFMILECPSSEIRDMLVNNTEFSKHHLYGHLKTPHVIIHITPREILESDSYLSWMEKFGSRTKHIILSNNAASQWNPFLRSVEFQTKLSAVDSQVFPFPSTAQPPMEKLRLPENCVLAENLLGYQFRPLRMEGLTRQNVRTVFNFKKTLAKSKAALSSLDERTLNNIRATNFASSQDVEVQEMSDSKVTFLGTGASMPCYFRSNSAFLLHTREGRSTMLVDCGEGTFSQLQYLYGEATDDVLASLACVFLSHSHADHHLGLMRFLLEYEKLCAKRQLKPLTIVGPWRLFLWLEEHCKFLGRSLPIRFLPFGEVKSGLVKNQVDEVLDALGLTQLRTVPVLHCRDSHGLVLNHSSGWKLVYSGDCRPSHNLIREGKDATLLIHEATYLEISTELPLRAKHCTLSEALKVSREMNASFTILTHFSKHDKSYYPHESAALKLGPRISTAFDFMTVRFSDLPRIHRLRPAISHVLESKNRVVSGQKPSSRPDVEETLSARP